MNSSASSTELARCKLQAVIPLARLSAIGRLQPFALSIQLIEATHTPPENTYERRWLEVPPAANSDKDQERRSHKQGASRPTLPAQSYTSLPQNRLTAASGLPSQCRYLHLASGAPPEQQETPFRTNNLHLNRQGFVAHRYPGGHSPGSSPALTLSARRAGDSRGCGR
jgi:hypothetical protein